MYLNRSRKLAFSARPSVELTAFCERNGQVKNPASRYARELTEQVLYIVATAVFCGMLIRRGGGSLCWNLNRTVGLPRGANDGLEDLLDSSSSSRPEIHGVSSPPWPAIRLITLT